MNNFFFLNVTATTEIYTLSLHDALPICGCRDSRGGRGHDLRDAIPARGDELRLRSRIRSEEHTSELQSRRDLVCRLLLEKKKKVYEAVHYPKVLYYVLQLHYLV